MRLCSWRSLRDALSMLNPWTVDTENGVDIDVKTSTIVGPPTKPFDAG